MLNRPILWAHQRHPTLHLTSELLDVRVEGLGGLGNGSLGEMYNVAFTVQIIFTLSYTTFYLKGPPVNVIDDFESLFSEKIPDRLSR